MKYIFAIILFALTAFPALAQNTTLQNDVKSEADTTRPVIIRPPLADSSLVGTSIFQLLEQEGNGNIEINQPQEFEQAYDLYLKNNAERKRNGYRIRLFFDNKQTARVESEELEIAFQEQFPEIPTYRSYTNPFFKVVVGDYRTKSEAVKELGKILPYFPKAIVVKENINFPQI